VSILDAMGDSDFGKPSEPEGDDGPQEVEEVEIEPAPEPEGDDAEIPSDDENEEPADDAAEPPAKEADTEDDETGTRMHRLRDGTQVSLGDLKKAYDEARGYRQAVPQFQQERARLEQERQALVAQQQQFQPVIAQVATILQQQIPPEPDPSLMQSDPIEFFTQKHNRDLALGRLQQVNAAQAEAQQRQAAEAQAQQKAYLQEQQQKLVEAIPVLRDPVKAKAFAADFHEVGAAAGFTAQELGQVYDHRLFKLAELAAIGLKAQREQGKAKEVAQTKAVVAAKKVVDKPPVQAPAARQAAGVREAQAARGAMDRLKKTGSPRDAEDVLSRFL
jgi:hypothetical protein